MGHTVREILWTQQNNYNWPQIILTAILLIMFISHHFILPQTPPTKLLPPRARNINARVLQIKCNRNMIRTLLKRFFHHWLLCTNSEYLTAAILTYKLSCSCMRLYLSISKGMIRKSYDIYALQVTWFRLSRGIQWPSSSCSGNYTSSKPEALHRNVNEEEKGWNSWLLSSSHKWIAWHGKISYHFIQAVMHKQKG